MRFLKVSQLGGASIAALALSACGGGGGGGSRVSPLPPPPSAAPTPVSSPPATSPPAPTTTNFDTSEYRNSLYSVASNALTAYNAGASGKGIKIGIVDSGINPALSEFAGRVSSASGDVYGSRGTSDESGHGTAVSAVAAAGRNGSGTMGVAFDATIVNLRADQPGSCASADGCAFYDDAIAKGVDAARLAGVKVINMSLGGSSPGPDLLAAMQRAVDAGIILVISAGNDGTPDPDSFALDPAKRFSGMVIIAGSVGVSTAGGIDASQISSFSNRAGTGADWYLMALGYGDRAPDNNGQLRSWSGTSFSAPTITGAVALMAQAFPNLTGAQIVSILLQSADDLGVAGVDTTFGHGRLNIARAFQPIGTTTLAGTSTAVSTTNNGNLPAAAGDAQGSASAQAVVLDSYERAYKLNVAKTMRAAPQGSVLARALLSEGKGATVASGPLAVTVGIAERRDMKLGFGVEKIGIGPEDMRRARLVAVSAVTKLDPSTALAFGFAEGAKAMERKLRGVSDANFLVARDGAAEPGFTAAHGAGIAVRRNLGSGFGLSLSGETGKVWQEVQTRATGSNYKLATATVDKQLGGLNLAASVSHLSEDSTLLGGRFDTAFGALGSSSRFFDLEASQSLGKGWSASLDARHGWTSLAGGSLSTSAYGFTLAKSGLLGSKDRAALRFAQPLRVESGGYSLYLPTSYSYETKAVGSNWERLSLVPSGRELNGELTYGTSLLRGKGWLGGNLYYRHQPGHIDGADRDIGAALRFTLGF